MKFFSYITILCLFVRPLQLCGGGGVVWCGGGMVFGYGPGISWKLNMYSEYNFQKLSF